MIFRTASPRFDNRSDNSRGGQAARGGKGGDLRSELAAGSGDPRRAWWESRRRPLITRGRWVRLDLMNSDRYAFESGRSSWPTLPASATALIALFAATLAAAEPDAAGLEFFEKSVRPLLVKHCYECHSTAEANGGLVLDTRDGVLKGGDSGAAIVPGDPDKSRLIEAVRYKNPDLQMPPKSRLSPAEVAVLEKWVTLGAPDPRKTEDAGSTAPTPVGMSIEEGREFWSFKPVADPPLPAVRNVDWVRTPIDAFVLAKLEAHGLAPAPPADKRTLIRRVTFDLTGLPPTPQEVDAFLADDIARRASTSGRAAAAVAASTAFAGAGTGSMSPAMPTRTDWMRTWPSATPGVIAITSSTPSTTTSRSTGF